MIVNGASGGGHSDASIANVARAFADAGAAAQILRLADPRQAAPLARRAADAGHRIVVAAGGDGTVSTVAGALAGTRSALGVAMVMSGSSHTGRPRWNANLSAVLSSMPPPTASTSEKIQRNLRRRASAIARITVKTVTPASECR